MSDSNRLKAFFNQKASYFDSYFIKGNKSLFRKVLDFLFRQSIQKRLQLTIKECTSMPQAHILDVGCGSGRSSMALAKATGNNVIGADFSAEMVKMANALARRHHLEDRCHFILGDFAEITFAEKFDVCVALGFFDYIQNPADYLNKMKAITTKKIIASFSAKWRWRNMVRIIRLKILKCPVYFYTEDTIKSLLKNVAIENYAIKNIGRDYLVIIDL